MVVGERMAAAAAAAGAGAAMLDPVSRLWLAFLDRVPLGERVLFVLGMYLVSEVWYMVIAGFYYLLWKRDGLLRYRIQKKAAMPDPALIKKCIVDVCFRSAVARVPFLFCLYDVYKYFGMPALATPLPSLSSVAAHWGVAMLVNDTAFYWTHRLMHHRTLYKLFHKKHHEFKVNVSVNSEYAEMAEIVLCDVLPTILGCLLLGSHFLVQLGWIVVRIWETCAAHSGYALPWCPFSQLALFNGPQVHDFHHSHNVGTYGAMTRFWDAVMGTDRQYHEYAQRHYDPDIPNKPPLLSLLGLDPRAPEPATPTDSTATTPASSPSSSPGRLSSSTDEAGASPTAAADAGLSKRRGKGFAPSPSVSPIRVRPGSTDSLASLGSAGVVTRSKARPVLLPEAGGR